MHDTPALHNMLQEDRAEAERSHPDVHPLPPGAFDLPGRVVKLSALEESAATEAPRCCLCSVALLPLSLSAPSLCSLALLRRSAPLPH